MKRFLVSVAVFILWPGASGNTATNTYSTGNIAKRIPAGGQLVHGLSVPHRGPVSFVRVSFRVTHPRSADLAVTLVGPRGIEVPLVTRRGAGRDLGTGKGCTGQLTVLDGDQEGNSIVRGKSPFVDNPYAPEGSLESLYETEARGRWALRIVNHGTSAGTLGCLTLDISRSVRQRLEDRAGSVRATLSFTERNFRYDEVRLVVARRGRTVADGPIEAFARCDCNPATSRPVGIQVRDLDGGEPEILVELYSGGAHCCSVTLILRYDARAAKYRPKFASWGNYGYRLRDFDRDGRVEFQASDERFVYRFTAYVFSAAPVQIWHYDRGRFTNVTRAFPAQVEKDAVEWREAYLRGRKQKDVDLRGIVAAYVADLHLLGRQDEADAVLDEALERGDLFTGKSRFGWPAGRAYVRALNAFLRRAGYIR